jgi:hypothetical protein
MEREDKLTHTLRLKTTEAIAGKFNYLKFYFDLYGNDLYSFDPAMYKKMFQHAVLLGIAAYKKDETMDMINKSPAGAKGIYKSLTTLTPSLVLNKLITSK